MKEETKNEQPEFDSEAGLELEGEAAQQAVEESAEVRAKSPFEVAAMQHSMMYRPFIEQLDTISGGGAKRILRYLVGYPFFVPELNPQNQEVEALAQLADKLVHAKFTMALCQAIEQEAKIMEEMNKIEPMPDSIPKATTEQGE